MSPGRILLGYLIAPLTVPLGFIVIGILGGSLRLEESPSVLMVYGIFPYLVATLFFVPLMLILKRTGMFGGVFFVVAGGLGGLVVGLISSMLAESNASLYLTFMASGVLSSVVFYKIAVADGGALSRNWKDDSTTGPNEATRGTARRANPRI